MKKKLLIIVGIIVAIIIGAIAYFVVSDFLQESKLSKELVEISELVKLDNIDMDKINEVLNRTITKNDYAEVEKSFKQYLKENFNNSIEIAEILTDEAITNILTAENFIEDGPDFVETKAYLTETKQKLEDCKKKYYEFLTEEKAMSYIDNKGLDNYYIELYKKEIIGDMENEKNNKSVENMINEIISLLDNSEVVIDFLIENKDSWQIKDDRIAFNSDNLSNKYNELIAEI